MIDAETSGGALETLETKRPRVMKRARWGGHLWLMMDGKSISTHVLGVGPIPCTAMISSPVMSDAVRPLMGEARI